MRVTQSTMSITALDGIQSSLGRVAVAQEQLSSSRRINRFSDAPVDTTSVLRMRAQQIDYDTYATAAEDGLAWLSTQDQALQSASELLRRARDLGLLAAADIRSPVEREAIATELEGIRDQLASLANTEFQGRSVFGGFQPAAVAQVAGVWTWVGDPSGAAQVLRRVGPNTVVPINSDGEDVFGFTTGNDVFGVLDTMAADARAANTAGLTAGLNTLDQRADTIRAGLGLVGTRANQIQGTLEDNELQSATLQNNRSNLEDADLAESALKLAQAQTSYQAALAAAARLSMASLLDFLR